MWRIDHKAVLFYLPAYSFEFDMIRIVWRQLKYRWRCFVTWTRETIDAELADLLAWYGTNFKQVPVNTYFSYFQYLHELLLRLRSIN